MTLTMESSWREAEEREIADSMAHIPRELHRRDLSPVSPASCRTYAGYSMLPSSTILDPMEGRSFGNNREYD